MQLTNQQGVSVVYDGVGGSMFEKNVSVLRTRGYLVAFGLANGSVNNGCKILNSARIKLPSAGRIIPTGKK